MSNYFCHIKYLEHNILWMLLECWIREDCDWQTEEENCREMEKQWHWSGKVKRNYSVKIGKYKFEADR